ncbi:hypothetical protein [Roseivirga seohaensis]|uniref:hypothetical protein n=1 Tax=Roseivirga seohaensis TaxID=1914963 RepID=UPI003BA9F710
MKYLTEKDQKKLRKHLEAAQEILGNRAVFFSEKACGYLSETQEAKYEDAEGVLTDFAINIEDMIGDLEELDNSISD